MSNELETCFILMLNGEKHLANMPLARLRRLEAEGVHYCGKKFELRTFYFFKPKKGIFGAFTQGERVDFTLMVEVRDEEARDEVPGGNCIPLPIRIRSDLQKKQHPTDVDPGDSGPDSVS